MSRVLSSSVHMHRSPISPHTWHTATLSAPASNLGGGQPRQVWQVRKGSDWRRRRRRRRREEEEEGGGGGGRRRTDDAQGCWSAAWPVVVTSVVVTSGRGERSWWGVRGGWSRRAVVVEVGAPSRTARPARRTCRRSSVCSPPARLTVASLRYLPRPKSAGARGEGG